MPKRIVGNMEKVGRGRVVGKRVSTSRTSRLGFTAMAVLPLLMCSGMVVGSPMASDSNITAHTEKSWRSFSGVVDAGLGAPDAFCRDKTGRYFVVDVQAQRILVLSRTFEVQAVLANSQSATISTPWLDSPYDIAADSHGRVYVADRMVQKIHILRQDLSYECSLPITHEHAGGPTCVAVDSQDRVIVGDYRAGGYSRILVYQWNEKGELALQKEFQFNPPDEPPICGKPVGIAVDSEDRIIVTETTTPLTWPPRERAIVFDKDCGWVSTLGSMGSGPGQFSQVDGVSVGPMDVVIVSSRSLWGWVSFFFANGTYAGRIGGPLAVEFYNGPSGLLVTEEGKLLVGQENMISQIDVEWNSLHPAPIEQTPVPDSFPGGLTILLTIVIVSRWCSRCSDLSLDLS